MLKQPLIVMFIALGIILGPSVLDVVKSHDKIHLLAEIGIAVLLFIVGLKLDLRIIKSIGKIVSTIPNNELSLQLIKMAEQHRHEGEIFVTANTGMAYRQLKSYDLDDEKILQPHQMAALYFYQSCIKNREI